MGFDEAFQAADSAVRALRIEGLRDIDRVVLEGSWNRQTYQTIAAEAGYTEGYLSRDIGPALWALLSKALGMQVKKTNFRTAIERWSKLNSSTITALSGPAPSIEPREPAPAATLERDRPLIDVADFRGRQKELTDLTEWVLSDRGRLLCLSGMPGAGKTWLAVKLAHRVQPHFQQVVYLDLQDGPAPSVLVAELLYRLQDSKHLPESFPACLELLAQTLAQQQTLLILDSVEVLCASQTSAGTYQPAYEDYDQVLEIFATHDHQSCIFWVGRELPRSSAYVSASSSRSHIVHGLGQIDLSELAVWPDNLSATEADWQYLEQYYGGLPAIVHGILLRLSSFGNNLAACLATLEQEAQFIHPYVDAWLAPLSAAEWTLITWMMISQRSLSLSEIHHRLENGAPLPVIESLCYRGVCRVAPAEQEPAWELTFAHWLRPYLQNRLLTSVQAAHEAEQIAILHRYPLVEADAPETIRQWQKTALLEEIAAILIEKDASQEEQRRFLQQAFARSRQLTENKALAGYSAGNLINLAQHWQIPLVGIDCHGLALKGADLQSDSFQGVSFQSSDFSETLLAKPLGQSPVIAISPDQRQVAVGDRDGRLLLWEFKGGRLLQALLSVKETIEAIAFSEEGEIVAEGRRDGYVRLWDLNSGFGPELFTATPGVALRVLAFSHDKAFLAGGDETGSLYVWRLASGEKVHHIAAHNAAVTAIAFSPCSRWLASCGQDAAAMEWSLETGASTHRFQGRLTTWLGGVAYRPTFTGNGIQTVVMGRDDGQLVVWDIATARPVRVLTDAGDTVMTLALSPNGRFLAVSDVSNTLSVWNLASRTRLYQISSAQAPLESLVFSPDSKALMTGCDYRVQLWEVASGKCLRSWHSDRHPATLLTLSAVPQQLLTSHDDYTLRCWRPGAAAQWLPAERLKIPSTIPISAVTASGIACRWAVGNEGGRVHIWQGDLQQWLTLSIHLTGSITALALSPDDRRLAIGDASGTVALWDLEAATGCWQHLQTHGDKVTALAFSPDGKQVFSGSRDRTVRGWDPGGNSILHITEHRRRVHTLCVSEDGTTLYSSGYDGTVRHWNIQSQACTALWQPQDRLIHCVARDSQGDPIAITSDTHALEIWSLTDLTCRTTLTPHADTLWHVGLSADGKGLVSASLDGEVRIWSLLEGTLQSTLRVDRPYEAMHIGGCTGLTESERQMLYSLGATDY